MDSNVNPLVATIAIVLVIISAGVWKWGSGRSEALSGPSEIAVGPDGHLFIQIQDKLVEHDETGSYRKTHDLADLGVDRLIGGISFFADGSLLLRRGEDARSLLDGIRAFSRATNLRSIVSENRDVGLHRCDLTDYTCRVFGASTIDFKATHSAFIDPASQSVFISDTSRHVLRKYSASGDAIAGPVDGFRFPNHLEVHDGYLYVADTNNHAIKILESNAGRFGTFVAQHSMQPDDAVDNGHRWPSDFTRVGEGWWVNIMTTSMNLGGIYLFDADWEYQRMLDLPPGADPISMLVFNDEVLITDWDNHVVHRFSAEGTRLGTFSSAGLNEVYAASREQRTVVLLTTWSIIGLLILAGIVLVLKGLEPAAPAEKADTLPRAEIPEHGIWLKPNPATVRSIRGGLIIVVAIIVAVALLTLYVATAIDTSFMTTEIALQLGAAISIVTGFVWMSRVNLATAIGLNRERITLQDHTGRRSSHAIHDVIYDGTTVATPDMAVALGNDKMPIYDRDQLESLLVSRLDAGQIVSPLKMQWELVRMRHPAGILTLVVILAIIAWALWSIIPHPT